MSRTEASASTVRQHSVTGHGSAVRDSNRRACLLALREAGAPLTLTELASRTGLSRPTVDSVLRDLSATGLIAHVSRSEEHTSELQSRGHLVCRLLLEKKKEDG